MSDAQQPPQPPDFPTDIPPYPPAPLPATPPVPDAQRFPTWKQALVMLGGGSALAVSACFGCLFTVMGAGSRTNTALEGLALFLAVLALGGLVAALVGVVLVAMRILRAMFGKKDDIPSGPSSTLDDGGSDSGRDSSSDSDSDGGGRR